MKYKFDFPIIVMFIAVGLDIITTLYFLTHNIGFESNPILYNLANISIIFIPIYLLLPIIFVPFFQDILRKSFAYFFAIGGLLLGINNLSLIFLDNAFLINTVGFFGFLILQSCIGLGIFLYFVYHYHITKSEFFKLVLKAGLFVFYIGFLELIFYLISITL